MRRFLLTLLFVFASVARADGGVKDDFKKMGHDIKQTAKDVGHKTKEAAHEVGQGFRKGWQKVTGKGAKTAAKSGKKDN